MNSGPATLVELLELRSGDKTPGAFTFLRDDGTEREQLSLAELVRRSYAIAALLQESGVTGERVLLSFQDWADFAPAYLGCVAAGVIAVPVAPLYPGYLARTLPRVAQVAANARATRVLTTTGELDALGPSMASHPELASWRWLTTDDDPGAPHTAYRKTTPGPVDVVHLQYTSGSTSMAQAVPVTHGQLMLWHEAFRRQVPNIPNATGVHWLPPYHDMGLITCLTLAIALPYREVLMPTMGFVSRPMTWLEAVERHRGDFMSAPNFAFDLCVRKSTPEERARLDLSHLTMAFNGAEKVRHRTLVEFAEAFAPSGFRPEAFLPCYGLAEATLTVTSSSIERPLVTREVGRRALELGTVGPPAAGDSVVLVSLRACARRGAYCPSSTR